jgi:hypothetical protein
MKGDDVVAQKTEAEPNAPQAGRARADQQPLFEESGRQLLGDPQPQGGAKRLLLYPLLVVFEKDSGSGDQGADADLFLPGPAAGKAQICLEKPVESNEILPGSPPEERASPARGSAALTWNISRSMNGLLLASRMAAGSKAPPSIP